MVANPRPGYSRRVGTGFVVAGVVVATLVALFAMGLGLTRRRRREAALERAALGAERARLGAGRAAPESARALEASIARLERRVADAARDELEAVDAFDLDDGLGPLSLEARRVVHRARALAERENETIRLERERG